MTATPLDPAVRGYAHPESLVTTEWVAANLERDDISIVESNEDPHVYHSGHVPGAAEVDWTRDLNHPLRRDYLDGEAFARLVGGLGIGPETTVVFYGDRSNWWAAAAFWVFHLFGHAQLRIMDGGRRKWIAEGRPLTREEPETTPAHYPVRARDDRTDRIFRREVLANSQAGRPLIDVRSREEYSGDRVHMPDYPNEGALRAGHVPGAVNIPWNRACNRDSGTFKSAPELFEIYSGALGADAEEVTVYCRIGERSSHTWFVLRYLLGVERVRNYDGSWTEWGNLVNMPIARPGAAE